VTDLDRLVARDHSEPHAYLGAHPAGDGVVVRAFRPDAEAVSVWVDGTTTALERVHPAGVFEGTLAGAKLPLSYHLDVAYPGGERYPVEDPYRFAPTIGELDQHLAGEGRHEELYATLGAHVREIDGVAGTSFAVWAPSARSVSVVGDFNGWDGRLHPMRSMGPSGIWELFVPGAASGQRYKYEMRTQAGDLQLRADPVAFATEMPPQTASVIWDSDYTFSDDAWMERRHARPPYEGPMSVYEVHLGSWRRDPSDPERLLSYGELAEQLAAYVTDLGFTHVELMPIMAHPFPGSWGYQVTGYYAPTPRYGTPDDFREFVDTMHAAGVGVLLDWVPAHFPRDEWALARFDGTALYEHADPRRGAHPDWGTLVFNLGRHEVRNFLLANALYWLEEFHVDGLRVDAVASMLYLDYSREPGEWLPNRFGGREDLEAVSFLQELNAVVHGVHPGVAMVAEESTAWPGVSRPTEGGGLGFTFKWNMGWMHDTLDYVEKEPVHRRWHHDELTFSLMYAWDENFVLPLSHDEVVHGKGALLRKVPGDEWQQFATLRALYGHMWAHPGKQLLFMGGELGQGTEWSEAGSLDWYLLDYPLHEGIRRCVADLNRAYRAEPALWEVDFRPEGFSWLVGDAREDNVLAYARFSADGARTLACLVNFSPVVRHHWRVPLPVGGAWREVLNTDAEVYGGSGIGNLGGVEALEEPLQGRAFSAALTLPPLATVWLAPAGQTGS
jgi:1,4-alpha-glucan branching enzyme